MKNDSKILFSIIIPTYNRAGMISKAINSVLSQTYPNWELLIINDGSTDNTEEIINSFKDNRIKYLYQKNSGKSAARNKGIDISKGDFIAFLDDDDYYLPDFLQRFYEKIKQENFNEGIYMCRVKEENDNNTFATHYLNPKYLNNPPMLIWMNGGGYFHYVTSRIIFETEKFNIQFPLGQDFHLLIRVVLKLPFYYIPEVLCVIRNHPDRSVIKEYKEDFITDGINRLDYLQDLIDNYFHELNKYIPAKHIYDKYNKIAYFYASTALKKKKKKYALKLMESISTKGILYKAIYYKLSIFFRSIFV